MNAYDDLTRANALSDIETEAERAWYCRAGRSGEPCNGLSCHYAAGYAVDWFFATGRGSLWSVSTNNRKRFSFVQRCIDGRAKVVKLFQYRRKRTPSE